MQAFRKEPAALLEPAAEGPAPAYAGAWRPSDRLRYERRPAAVRHGERCLAHHAEQFRNVPSAMFWGRRERAETPRYRSGGLRPPALLPAVAKIYKARGATPSSAIFTAFSVVIGEPTLHDGNSMFLIYSNGDRGNVRSVANCSQTAPIGVRLRTESFWGLLKDTHRAMLNACRHASYPPRSSAGRKRPLETLAGSPSWRTASTTRDGGRRARSSKRTPNPALTARRRYRRAPSPGTTGPIAGSSCTSASEGTRWPSPPTRSSSPSTRSNPRRSGSKPSSSEARATTSTCECRPAGEAPWCRSGSRGRRRRPGALFSAWAVTSSDARGEAWRRSDFREGDRLASDGARWWSRILRRC